MKVLTHKQDIMKKVLLAVSLALVFASCGKDENLANPTEPVNPVAPKEYIVNLGFSGEITKIEESPLGRSVGSDLYGIQIYSMPTKGSEYKAYAYGLFDDKTKMTIKLMEGYKYKFVSTMVVNGKNIIQTSISDNNLPSYYFPFTKNMATETATEIGNSFVYTSSLFFDGLNQGTTYLKGAIYGRPNADRYYGEVVDYTPTEGGNVSINMRRVAFGAKFITEGLTGGKIKITLGEAPNIYIVHPDAEVQDIFTLSNAEAIGDYTETIPVSVSWEKEDGAIVPLVDQDIVFKRNKLTTITIKVKDNSINNGVDISQENTPMGDGGSITIDTSSNTDSEVDPKP